MDTAEAVSAMQIDEVDMMLVRIDGSISYKKLPPELQGKLGEGDGEQMIEAALAKAQSL